MPDTDVEERARGRVGRTIGDKYLLERLLGVGGMAAVYAARHRNGARAAVKILHPHISRNKDVRARFLREGYAANRAEHPGTVRVVDDDVVSFGDDEGTAYLVMELLEGESALERVQRQRTLSEADVLWVAEDVLDVLEAAHAKGIVHRDLKPDNLFIVRDATGRERVKVLDFGIARIADGAGQTKIGTMLGTPSYMAPEQAQGQRDLIDGRSDLFSLGATMFRSLTARRVHEGGSVPEILAKMATTPAPPLRSVAPAVSASVAAIVDRALRFERDARYRDAAEMREDVRAARAGRPLPSLGPGVQFSDEVVMPAVVPHPSGQAHAMLPEPSTIAQPKVDDEASELVATSVRLAPELVLARAPAAAPVERVQGSHLPEHAPPRAPALAAIPKTTHYDSASVAVGAAVPGPRARPSRAGVAILGIVIAVAGIALGIAIASVRRDVSPRAAEEPSASETPKPQKAVFAEAMVEPSQPKTATVEAGVALVAAGSGVPSAAPSAKPKSTPKPKPKFGSKDLTFE